MTDRPIIFSGPMVCALLDGRKTQTRRLATSPLRKCEAGDRLYVREHWRTMAMHDELSPTRLGERYRESIYRAAHAAPVLYIADAMRQGRWADDESAGWSPGKHRQGMHMPRWASRLTLIVEAVRRPGLLDITRDDILAEGCPIDPDYRDTTQDGSSPYMVAIGPAQWESPTLWFRRLWDSLHTKPGARWEDNPDLVALTFRVERGNIDRITA